MKQLKVVPVIYKMRVHIIRHAKAAHNVTNNYQLFDPEVVQEWYLQAAEMRKLYDIRNPSVILSSTSSRTLQTAISLFPSSQVYATGLLLEYNTGVPCNTPRSITDLQERFPTVDFNTYQVKALPFESTFDQGTRRAECVGCLLMGMRPHYQEVVLVTHGNFIKNLTLALTSQFSHNELPNAGCISFDM